MLHLLNWLNMAPPTSDEFDILPLLGIAALALAALAATFFLTKKKPGPTPPDNAEDFLQVDPDEAEQEAFEAMPPEESDDAAEEPPDGTEPADAGEQAPDDSEEVDE